MTRHHTEKRFAVGHMLLAQVRTINTPITRETRSYLKHREEKRWKNTPTTQHLTMSENRKQNC